jgi:hypothetical protein
MVERISTKNNKWGRISLLNFKALDCVALRKGWRWTRIPMEQTRKPTDPTTFSSL